MDQLQNSANDEWLKRRCNKYVNGICQTLACMERGGYKRGKAYNHEEVQAAYALATCEPHEILQELNTLRSK